MLLIQNGRVLDPASKTDAPLDVLLEGQVIRAVGGPGEFRGAEGAEVFDATGMIVAPGFIDLHAHLREPGQESSETIETGTKSGARRIHRRLLHAQYQAGARQRFHHPLHRG